MFQSGAQMKTWIIIVICMSIPLINIVFVLFMAFASSVDPALKAWARAILMFVFIGTIHIVTTLVLFGWVLPRIT